MSWSSFPTRFAAGLRVVFSWLYLVHPPPRNSLRTPLSPQSAPHGCLVALVGCPGFIAVLRHVDITSAAVTLQTLIKGSPIGRGGDYWFVIALHLSSSVPLRAPCGILALPQLRHAPLRNSGDESRRLGLRAVRCARKTEC